MHRTHLWALLAAVPLSLATVHCVGDEPSTVVGDEGDAAVGSSDGGGDESVTTGDGGGETDGGKTGEAGVDGGPYDSCAGATNCPNQIGAATSLELWLRGGFGETCTGGRLLSWKDQSGKGRDATPGSAGDDGDAGLPPQCGAAMLNGDPVVTFTAPGSGSGNVDETLDVDLAFLGGAAAYSIFVVVERTSNVTGGFLATDFLKPPMLACQNTTSDAEYNFFFGYEDTLDYTDVLGYSEGCAGLSLVVSTYTANTPELAELFFSPSSPAGHSIYQNGSLQNFGGSGNDLGALRNAPGHGVIGRGPQSTTDTRLHGNIAEVVIFSTMLSTADRQNVEHHLKTQWALTF